MRDEKTVFENLNGYHAKKTTVTVIFHELKGFDSKSVITNAHIPCEVPFSGYGDLLLKGERIYDLF